ncbi:MAG: glycine cleavage system protein GcvH [Clostridia bacterium]|nr:glycine cleavage system protein GcvH [Clostridia bacterium]
MNEAELKYSKDHEWVGVDGDAAYVGITNYAQIQLGDIVYVELPEVGIEIDKDEVVCAVESVKTAADILMPVSGVVTDVNKELEDTPEMINTSPYEAWIIQVKIRDMAELDGLMNESEYADFCEKED